MATSKRGSWSFVLKFGSSVAIGTALLTIKVAFGLLAAVLRPPAPDEPELEELELLPHAASTSTATAAVATDKPARLARAFSLLVGFIVSASVVRVILPPSLVRF